MMTIKEIIKLQEAYNVTELQNRIFNGSVWSFQGSAGRFAMSMLESGVCFLGEAATYDYYGNRIPSRNDLEDGTKGTLGNAIQFWSRVVDGDFDIIEFLEENF
jgi:hypothetical protein